jgi:hypothetical protein
LLITTWDKLFVFPNVDFIGSGKKGARNKEKGRKVEKQGSREASSSEFVAGSKKAGERNKEQGVIGER